MAVISEFYTNASWGMDYRSIFCAVIFPPTAQRPFFAEL
jgi:hypothetical protein